ncbi:hypothetical protein ABEB36_008306 [Hypothenemus hampei]|uniref:HTH cro/C1-type domain-containing protein n=1 Tax=Hypothenemus hampei TaxID=57062 RepID=A0ABD1ELF3_HYPHA
MPRNLISDFNKSKIVVLLQKGFTQSDIAEIVGVTQSTVSKNNKKFQETNDVKDRPRSGRKRCTTAVQDRQISIIAQRNLL